MLHTEHQAVHVQVSMRYLITNRASQWSYMHDPGRSTLGRRVHILHQAQTMLAAVPRQVQGIFDQYPVEVEGCKQVIERSTHICSNVQQFFNPSSIS